jgi:formylglycine-generating enzyme required for sulfatase activity
MKKVTLNITEVAGIDFQLVEIPKGQIELRDDRKKTKWTVAIDQFLLSRFLVTQDLYFDITGEFPGTFRGGKKPVETVSWKDAITFCNLLSHNSGLRPCYDVNSVSEEITFDPDSDGYRLPSEAEWEYACKAGTAERRYGVLDKIAWYKDNSDGSTHDVGKKEPNAWGLYDMIGNVWEWSNDLYDETSYGTYRIIRGGGWFDEERSCLATNRRRSHPSRYRIDDLGFRIARNLNREIK